MLQLFFVSISGYFKTFSDEKTRFLKSRRILIGMKKAKPFCNSLCNHNSSLEITFQFSFQTNESLQNIIAYSFDCYNDSSLMRPDRSP